MRKLIPTFIALAIAVFIWSRHESPKPEEAVAPTSPVVTSSTTEPVPAAAPARPEASGKRITAIAPSVDAMRADVAKDPHAPSKSLVEFSTALAPRLEAAMRDPAKAEEFFAELEDCVDGPTQKGNTSIQALCLINLRRLGKVPELRERVEAAWKKADPELRRLAE